MELCFSLSDQISDTNTKVPPTTRLGIHRAAKSQSNSGRWEAGPVLLQHGLLQLVQHGHLPVHWPPPCRSRLCARPLAGLYFSLLPILETVTPPSLLHNIIYMFPCPPIFDPSYFHLCIKLNSVSVG